MTSSVPALVSAQNSLAGIEAALLMTSGESPPIDDVGFPVFDCKAYCSGGSMNLPAPFNRPDLVIFHSTYIPLHAQIASKLCNDAIPYIITPRGGMTKGAQKVKWFKKRAGNWLFFNNMVRHAAALHCLTQNEANETKGWGQPIFIVGNGTAIPSEENLAILKQSDELRFVFIGRLDPRHKGLDILLEACALIKPVLLSEHVQVDLYGSDHHGSMAKLKRQISRLELNDVARLHGPIIGGSKTRLLKESDVFIHTSRFEGHPMAVLEALAHGVPCLLTPGTNMSSEVAAAGAGWEVKPTPGEIAEGLNEVITQKASLEVAGKRARALAIEKYSWQQVARDSVAAYSTYVKPVG